MLAWVVIDRQHLRQAAPFASLHSSPLFPLPHLSPLLPVAYALPLATAPPQPLCNQSVTHSFYLDGGWIPPVALPSRQRSSRIPIPCSLSPFFSISCALFCTFLHSPKNSTLLFSGDSALCVKKHNHRGWGRSTTSSQSPSHNVQKQRRPSRQRWGLLRKGRAVFRREDRVDCFVVSKNYVRGISC